MPQHNYYTNILYDLIFLQKHNAEDTSEEESDKEVCTAGLDLTGLCLFY